MKRILILAFCSLIVFSSCHHFMGEHIKGTGNVIIESRNFSNFKGVEVSSAIHLYVKQDSVFSVRVEVDDNLQQYVITREENGILYIKQQDNTNLDATGKIKVFVSAPVFIHLEASGACHITGENLLTNTTATDIHVSGASEAKLELKSPKVAVDMSGASSIVLGGETKDLSVAASGASNAYCFDLLSESADIDLSGASNAEAFASIKINAVASGASHIKYKGNAALTKDESGAGSVNKVE